MSSLIFSLSEQEIFIATDTLAMNGENFTPFFFTTKVYFLPHLRGVMCGTGIGDFATDWYLRLDRFLAKDFIHLDEFVTNALLEVAEKYHFDTEVTSTIYHFGYSEMEKEHFAFVYRSTNDFKSEKLGYGFGVKPPISNSAIELSPQNFVEIMKLQQIESSQIPIEKRIFIGGEILLTVLRQGTIVSQTIYRFDDYEELYNEMCLNLPQNQKFKELLSK
ncbi:hypothetical protein BH10ACI1_BH10ACI1_18620 [soil metagenome]